MTAPMQPRADRSPQSPLCSEGLRTLSLDHLSPVWPSVEPGALAGIRICDFTGQLAGAGATKILAALGAEVIRAGRDAINFLAERLGAHELFVGLQTIGLACGIVYSPEEMLADDHFAARGFPVEIDHDGTAVTYPGAPYKFSATPWQATRAPRLGEHQDLLTD